MSTTKSQSIIIATKPIWRVYERARELDSRAKFLNRQLEPLKDRIKEFMDDKDLLVSKTGLLLATNAEQAKKKGDCFDFERFIADHPNLWEEYKRPPFTYRALRLT